MKTYYLYVPDGDKISIDSVVIWLSVGKSDREQARLALLENYAMDLGQFLRVRDEDTEFWLNDHLKRLFPGSNCPRLHMISVQMSVIQCFRMVIDGSLEAYCRNYEKPINFLNTLLSLDANYMRIHSKKFVIRHALRGTRKYLSHSVSNYVLGGMVCVALILLAAVTDFLGCLIINLIV